MDADRKARITAYRRQAVRWIGDNAKQDLPREVRQEGWTRAGKGKSKQPALWLDLLLVLAVGVIAGGAIAVIMNTATSR